MKRLLCAIILAIALSFGGVGESQTESKFPDIDKKTAFEVKFQICNNDVLFSITGFGKESDPSFYAYEINNTLFAVIEFVPELDQATAIYVLKPNKKVLKFVPTEFKKIESPCETLKLLRLNNGNKF